MLDIGLLKISLGGVFSLLLAPVDGFNPAGYYNKSFPNLAGQSYPLT